MSKLYCGNSDCGAYLGSMGADSCVHCGWIDPDTIEAAATEPLLQRIAHLEATASATYGRGHADAHSMLSERIAELEQRNSDLHEDIQRFKKHALNEKAARLELERQLEEERKDAERWRTFLSTRPQSTHEVIIQAIDDAAMRKGQS